MSQNTKYIIAGSHSDPCIELIFFLCRLHVISDETVCDKKYWNNRFLIANQGPIFSRFQQEIGKNHVTMDENIHNQEWYSSSNIKKRFTTFWQRYALVTSRSEQSNISINSNEICSSTKQNLMTVQDFLDWISPHYFLDIDIHQFFEKKRYKNTFQPHLMNEGCKFSSNCDFNGCELMHFLWSNGILQWRFFFLE